MAEQRPDSRHSVGAGNGPGRLGRRAALLAAGGLVAGSFAKDAFAGFGSVGSASTSSVPLREIEIDQLSALPFNKAVQFQKALVGRRGAKQIDSLLNSIEISEGDKEQLRLLQVRVLSRE